MYINTDIIRAHLCRHKFATHANTWCSSPFFRLPLFAPTPFRIPSPPPRSPSTPVYVRACVKCVRRVRLSLSSHSLSLSLSSLSLLSLSSLSLLARALSLARARSLSRCMRARACMRAWLRMYLCAHATGRTSPAVARQGNRSAARRRKGLRCAERGACPHASWRTWQPAPAPVASASDRVRHDATRSARSPLHAAALPSMT